MDVFVGGRLFTSFLYPDTLKKPVLYPLRTARGTITTRGFRSTPSPATLPTTRTTWACSLILKT